MRIALVAALFLAACALRAADLAAPPKPLPATEIEQLVRDLGSDEFDKRQEAEKRLAEQGEAARKPLEAALASSKDAEVLSRARSILEKIDMPRDLAALSPERLELATMKTPGFAGLSALDAARIAAAAGPGGSVVIATGAESDDDGNGDSITVLASGHGDNVIVNMGRTRIILEGQGYKGFSSSTVLLRGAGRSSGQAGELLSSYANGEAKVSFRKIEWSIVNGETLKLGKTETKLGTGNKRRVLFVDANGKVLYNVEVPIEKKKKDAAAEQDGAGKK